MAVEYIGWEPYLERGGEPRYCEPGPEVEPEPEGLADDEPCIVCTISGDVYTRYCSTAARKARFLRLCDLLGVEVLSTGPLPVLSFEARNA
jgi:hypothetical protein